MTTFHLVQTSLHWEDIDANLVSMEEKLSRINSGVAVLPEMFSTGFSMNSRELAEPMSGKTVNWLSTQAASRNIHICGSAIIEEDGDFYNRFLWASPDGNIASYDKRHLFRMAGEHEYYSAGAQNLDIQLDDMRIRPQVCYDLRFPAWSRNTDNYDVLMYVANWPGARREQWLALLKARAIENLCYVIGLNRVGEDGNGVAYTGDSIVYGPEGNELLSLGSDDTIGSIELQLQPLADYRDAFPAHLDADSFEIT